MAIDKDQLRKLITDVLIGARLYSKDAVELLMLTAAQESHCGTYLEQVNGPALGIFQMEPETMKDIYMNYLKYHPDLLELVHSFIIKHPFSDALVHLNLRANLPYQIVIARIFYLRFSEPLPDWRDIHRMALYYKKYWNTKLGAATIDEAINNYMRFAV